MARVALKSPSILGTLVDASGNARVGASATIQKRSDASVVTVYQAETGGATWTNPGQVISGADGTFPGWVDEQGLQAVITGGGITGSITVPFEAKSGIPPSASAAVTPDQGNIIAEEGFMPTRLFNASGQLDAKLTRNSVSSVTVDAGSAWIDQDGVYGTGKLYVSWPTTTLSGIPVAGDANGRLDQIAIQLTGGYGTTASVTRLQGTGGQASAVTLDNRLGAASVPNATLLVHDLRITTAGLGAVYNTDMRDRRSWATREMWVDLTTATTFVITGLDSTYEKGWELDLNGAYTNAVAGGHGYLQVNGINRTGARAVRHGGYNNAGVITHEMSGAVFVGDTGLYITTSDFGSFAAAVLANVHIAGPQIVVTGTGRRMTSLSNFDFSSQGGTAGGYGAAAYHIFSWLDLGANENVNSFTLNMDARQFSGRLRIRKL